MNRLATKGGRPDYVPERGDVVWLQFSPQVGHEQAGRRPALVISPQAYNGKAGLALLCPITSKSKGYPFEVELQGDFAITGAILADQIKSLDWRVRRAEFAGQVGPELMAEVLGKIRPLLD